MHSDSRIWVWMKTLLKIQKSGRFLNVPLQSKIIHFTAIHSDSFILGRKQEVWKWGRAQAWLQKTEGEGKTYESSYFLTLSLFWKRTIKWNKYTFSASQKRILKWKNKHINKKKNYFPNQPLTERRNKVCEPLNQNPKWFISLAIVTIACLHFRHDTQPVEGRVTVWGCKDTRAQAKQINLDFNRTHCFKKYWGNSTANG